MDAADPKPLKAHRRARILSGLKLDSFGKHKCRAAAVQKKAKTCDFRDTSELRDRLLHAGVPVESRQVHPQWKRLLRVGSAPGWVVVIVFACRIVDRALNIDFTFPPIWMSRLIALWNFLQTPGGNVVLAIAGTVWLVGLVFWPNRSQKNTGDAPPGAVDPKSSATRLGHPVLPAAEPVVVEPTPETAETAEPYKETWIAAEGHIRQLTSDHAGCTAVLTSGQRTITARFDDTWTWYLSHLKNGTTLSVEGKILSEPTDQQLRLLDCVCPDGIRVRPRAH